MDRRNGNGGVIASLVLTGAIVAAAALAATSQVVSPTPSTPAAPLPAQAPKVNQPWSATQKWASFESRVKSCTGPTPFARVAMDDWVCNETGQIKTLVWWGAVNTGAQINPNRKYYIAVYPNMVQGQCKPGTSPIQKWCLTPTSTYAGLDCQNKRVYRFKVALNPPFNQVRGRHYWLQISEADAESARPGVEDFRWSGHRPHPLKCRALQRNPAMATFTPLIDPCDNKPDELAFQLWK